MTDDDVWELFAFLGHAAHVALLERLNITIVSCMLHRWPPPELVKLLAEEEKERKAD